MLGLRRIESIAPRHASDRFFTGEIVIVDVRTHPEYEQVRVPGAVHIPLHELGRRIPPRRPERGGRNERLAGGRPPERRLPDQPIPSAAAMSPRLQSRPSKEHPACTT